MTARTLSITLAVVLLALILELFRRERLTFKYAAPWIMAALAGVVLGACDVVVRALSHRLGFRLPSNFIFFSILCLFVFLGLLLTMFLCQQNDRNDKVAQKIGLLEQELEEVKRRMENKGSSDAQP